MAAKPFIRVKDKRTRHQYDVHEQAFDPEIHEELPRFPRSATARAAKTAVLRRATARKDGSASPQRATSRSKPTSDN